MPLYEYVCEGDGERITLLRPMREADEPVEDPAGRGRVFARVHSTFGVGGTSAGAGSVSLPMGGGCGCGKVHGCGH
jgi:hypothetical protein